MFVIFSSPQNSHIIQVVQHYANKLWVKGINILREPAMSSGMLSPLYIIQCFDTYREKLLGPLYLNI